MTASDQLDLVDLLWEQERVAENALAAMEDLLNPAIDSNENDKLLMEIFDVVTDAEEDLQALRTLLDTLQRRDLEEEV